MPIPIRSSDRKRSRAWALVRDITQQFYSMAAWISRSGYRGMGHRDIGRNCGVYVSCTRKIDSLPAQQDYACIAQIHTSQAKGVRMISKGKIWPFSALLLLLVGC